EAPLLIPDHELFGGKNAERFPDRACAHVEFVSQRVDMDARSRRQGPGKYHLADLPDRERCKRTVRIHASLLICTLPHSAGAIKLNPRNDKHKSIFPGSRSDGALTYRECNLYI